MRANRSRALLGAAATAALSIALFVPTASADSLVYMKGGNVWISHGDGSNPRQITGAPNTWSWPTEDDAGNILVAGGAEYVSAGVEDTAGSQIYRLNQQGGSLAAPQQTPGSMSTVGCIAYPPQNLRVAPDGQHYAYYTWMCNPGFITEVGTVGGQGFTSSEYISDFRFPYWTDNSDFVISRGVVPIPDSALEWAVHPLGSGVNGGNMWFGDDTYAGDPGGWATGFDGMAVARDGSEVATLEEDAGNWPDGAARNVVMRLWSVSGASTPVFKCELTLPPDPDVTAWFYNAGPTFSPDGTRLAFAEPDGIHIANVSNLDDCSSVTAPLVIADSTQPFWSAADEAANAGYVAPANNGNGSGNTTTHDTTAPVLGAVTMRPARFAVAKQATPMSAKKRRRSPKGSIVRYTLSEPAAVTLTVEQSLKGHKKGRRCLKGSRRHARACTLISKKGTLTRSGQSGANQLGFSGRLGRKKLSAGSYTLVVRATDAAGNRSRAKTLHFTILKR